MELHSNPVYQQALNLHQQGQWLQAEQLYRQLLEQYPAAITLYNYLGDSLIGQGKVEEAIAILEKGQQQGVDNPEAFIHLSAAYAQKQDFPTAISFNRRFIEAQPNLPGGHYNLANLFYYNNQPTEAIASYQKCLELDPGMAYAHYNLANLLAANQQTDQAIEHYAQCIKAAPTLVAAYLNLAKLFNDMGRYEEAIQIYQTALQIEPGNGPCHQQLGMTLHIVGQLDKATSHYQKALELNGRNPDILMLLGNASRDQDDLDLAKQYYEQVLQMDPDNALALQNVRRISSKKIPSWHFNMLADTARNEAFDQALQKVIRPPLKVLDIGTGTGLLAMMACRAGAAQVYACEMVPALAEAAQEIVAANGYQDKIQVINKKSTALKVGEDLSEKADLLVSEILDAGLLGEGVLPSIRHALNNLVKPDAIIIPQAADVYGVLIQTDHLHKVYPVNNIAGFDLSVFNQFALSNEYVSLHLKHIPHQKLSDPFPILSIDFRQLPAAAAENQAHESQLSIQATEEGEVHAVAFWFKLHLDDQISLSSGPDGEMIHWEQAVFFLNKSQRVKRGDTLNLRVLQSDLLIRFKI